MKYRIVRITDKQGNNKALYDRKVAKRLGRIVDSADSDIMAGFPAYLCCVNGGSILTTTVRHMSRSMDCISFETRNSVYYLERVKVNDGGCV